MDQTKQYEQYLRILSIFHYVVGGVAALFACFPIIHFLVGIGMLAFSFIPTPEGTGFPFILPFTFAGLFFTLLAGSFILLGWTFAICVILAGRFLATRKRYMFCLVMGGVECMFMPFGTVLGVFTIITLLQPIAKEWFAIDQAAELEAA
jgi:hypothetical protein